jgi:hypothetical protein
LIIKDATGSTDANKLAEMAQWFADNIWLIIKYRKFIMVNIANGKSLNSIIYRFYL